MSVFYTRHNLPATTNECKINFGLALFCIKTSIAFIFQAIGILLSKCPKLYSLVDKVFSAMPKCLVNLLNADA